MSRARSWTREPLIPFVVVGGLLFGLFAVVGDGGLGQGADRDREITVSAATQARIASQQARRLGRAPTEEELDAGVRAWADAELLYREARALELDRGDPIVRRRLLQKMQFVLEEEEGLPEPSDAELEVWIAGHRERFEQSPRLRFRHVFVATPKAASAGVQLQVEPEPEPDVEARLAELEGQLSEGAEPSTLGEAFVLGQDIPPKTAAELDRQFGQAFGQAALGLDEDGGWHRLRSLYGWHLVHVEERLPGRLSTVDEVRSQAREGLLREARESARSQAMDALRERYDIALEDAQGG